MNQIINMIKFSLVVLFLFTTTIVSGEAATIDYNTVTTCAAGLDSCQFVIPTGVFKYNWKVWNPETSTVYSGTMSTNPGAVLSVYYQSDITQSRLMDNDQTIATSDGTFSNDVYHLDTESDVVRTPLSYWIEISHDAGCEVPPGLLNTYFVPQLTDGSGFFKINGVPVLSLTVELPSHIFAVELDFGTQCPTIPVHIDGGVETGTCFRHYTITADYINKCQFQQATVEGSLEFSGSLTVRAKVNLLGVFDGDESVTRTLQSPIQWKTTLQTTVTVGTVVDVINEKTCNTEADCNGQPCNDGFCGCLSGGFSGTNCETDVQAPTCSPPADITILTSTLPVGLPESFTGVTASDNKTPLADLIIVHSLGANPSFTTLGLTTASYTITDAAGLSSQCFYDILVKDNGNPALLCPAEQTTKQWLSWSEVSVTDGIDTDIVSEIQSTQPAEDGQFTITYSASDDSGNVGQCSFQLIWDTTAPSIVCPSLSFPTDAGKSYATLSLTLPTATDSLSGLSDAGIQQSQIINVPSTQFQLQSMSTISVLTVEDKAENSASCNYRLEVYDNEAPKTTCPSSNVQLNTVTGKNYGTLDANNLVSSTDNVAVTSFTSFDPDAHYSVGTHPLSYTACDAANLCSSCPFSIVVSDNEDPVVTCPISDINASTDLGLNTAIVTFTTTSTDNTGVSSTTLSHDSGALFSIGSTQVTYTAYDAAGNSAQCQFNIVVADNENPKLGNCPTDINQYTDLTKNFAVVSFATPSSSDNNAVQSLIATPLISGSAFPLGKTTVTWTLLDQAGNQSTCSFDVTISDNEKPVITCPANINKNTDLNLKTAVATWTEPVTSDNVGINVAASTNTHNSGFAFSIGVTTVTYEVFDAAGNSKACQFTVTVTDTQAPSITCPANINQSTDLHQNFASVTLISATASDNNAVVSIVSTHSSGSFPEAQVTTITWTATDAAGLSDSCDQTVTITDNEAPRIVCPSDITEETELSKVTADVTFALSSSIDNVGITSSTSSPLSGSSFPMGETTVTWTTTDANNNGPATCQFKVSILDKEQPSITCPSSFSTAMDENQSYFTAAWSNPTNIGDNHQVVSTTSDIAQGTQLSAGDHVITYTTTDASGNSRQCKFTITVGDLEPPSITCPASFTTGMDASKSYFTGVWEPATAVDNIPVASGPITITSDIALGTQLSSGAHVITYTATDSSNNSKSCQFTITVEDREKPTISCALSSVSQSTTTTSAAMTWTIPTFSDNVLVTSGPTYSHALGSVFPIGITTVTATVKDAANNSKDCQFTVTVTDGAKPSITCPSNISRGTDNGKNNAVVTWADAATNDNVGVVSVTYSPAKGSHFPLFETTVTVTATDAANNSETCTFTVTITDNEKPAIVCPSSITLSMEPDQNYALYPLSTFTAASSNDNVEVISISFSELATKQFTHGPHTIIGTATDAAGNFQTCSFIITVQDNQLPIIVCQSQTITLPSSPSATPAAVVALLRDVDATDNDVVGPIELNHLIDFTKTFQVGKVSKEYCYTDPNGNGPACCNVSVEVIDATKPSISCPVDMNIEITSGSTSKAVFAATATDNNGQPSLSYSHSSNVYDFPLGVTTVYVAANDGINAASTCEFKVTVVDKALPELTCPSNKSVDITTNTATTTVAHGNVLVTDNSGESLTATTDADTSFSIGVEAVTYTATDSAGNSNTCQFDVTVNDKYAPVATNCPSNGSINQSNGSLNPNKDTPLIWQENFTATGDLVLSQSSTATATLNVGPNTITYTAADAAGNIGTCEYIITLIDDVAPQITCPTATTLYTPSNSATADWSWDFTSLTTGEASLQFVSADLQNALTGTSSLSIGPHEFGIQILDEANNSSPCTVIVNIVDNVAPLVDCSGAGSQKRLLDAQATTAPVTFGDIARSDNSNAGVELSGDYSSGQNFPIGTTTVTITATDNSNNSAQCTFDIIVLPPYPVAALQAALTGVSIEETGDGVFTVYMTTELATAWPHRAYHNDELAHTLPAGASHLEENEGAVCTSTTSSNWDGTPSYGSCRQTYTSEFVVNTCSFADTVFAYKLQSHCLPGDCVYGSSDFTVEITLSASNYCDQSLADAIITASLRTISPSDFTTYETAQLGSSTALPLPEAVTLAIPSQILTGLINVKCDNFELAEVEAIAASQTYYSDPAYANPLYSNTLVTADANGACQSSKATCGLKHADFTSFAFPVDNIPVETQYYTKLTAQVKVTYNLGTAAGSNRRRLMRHILQVDVKNSNHMNTLSESKLASPTLAVAKRNLLQDSSTGTQNKKVATEWTASNYKFELPLGICMSTGAHFIGFSITKPNNMDETSAHNSIVDHFATLINSRHGGKQSVDNEHKLSLTRKIDNKMFYTLIYSDVVKSTVNSLYLESPSPLFKLDSQLKNMGIVFDNTSNGALDKTSISSQSTVCGNSVTAGTTSNNNSNNNVPAWGIALIAVIASSACCFFIIFAVKRRNKDEQQIVQSQGQFQHHMILPGVGKQLVDDNANYVQQAQPVVNGPSKWTDVVLQCSPANHILSPASKKIKFDKWMLESCEPLTPVAQPSIAHQLSQQNSHVHIVTDEVLPGGC